MLPTWVQITLVCISTVGMESTISYQSTPMEITLLVAAFPSVKIYLPVQVYTAYLAG